ncbi:spermatid nuclear transition protein 3-like [Cervus elaphus]|uniref:spermatid nuclear transition protein 3-like n=1 Tax=Cervus canadensis TaxID=1574408 RepID=UPI0018BF376C|nr:spermatid nuclear transition protein 3-like [Cervus canadensis]XP_043751110.1 spermatid nuclear transition protein 3-like [Cervus elaphus]XP_043751111.1 spermatid nuclear transition protein 3-like [Cervus elaphus]XP_043751112.1 spermatid nuclear transition protein 3-like [Cervus elaphus]XP_043751113.1 spermatid nuclear transition protein 3-like [Cervus elaphus]XP_043751114.1 spermatid nuclear transition protein 3-like [Cervus elaphus]XP_043751115.1 spermatid nuclear transition protein 3-li
MTNATRKPRQSRGVAMRFASRKNGTKKTLCQRRGRGGVKARNMTMRVRRPLQGTFRKKIRSYATQSTKLKKTRKANCFFSRCGRKKSNRSRKSYQTVRQSQGRRQNPKRK